MCLCTYVDSEGPDQHQSAQSYQDLLCPLIESLGTVEHKEVLLNVFKQAPMGKPKSGCFTLVLLNLDIPCLCKHCRARSVGF